MVQVEEQAHDATSYTKTYWYTPAETQATVLSFLNDIKESYLRSYRMVSRIYATATGQPSTAFVPTLTSLNPNTKVQGAAAFTLTATGSNFTPGSTINWAGIYLKTTFVNSTTLTAQIDAGKVAAAATVPVKVYTDSDVSGTVTFSITATRSSAKKGKK